jgi:hypothetical protein
MTFYYRWLLIRGDRICQFDCIWIIEHLDKRIKDCTITNEKQQKAKFVRYDIPQNL